MIAPAACDTRSDVAASLGGRAIMLALFLSLGAIGCGQSQAPAPGSSGVSGTAEPSAAGVSRDDSHSGTARAPTQTARPSILLVTIDTWRSDAVGASGSGRVATPNLDALAAGGLYLPKVQTSCPLTTPAHATILTGLTPYRHGIRDNLHYRLNAGLPTLASVLAGAGYRTAAIVSAAPLRKVYGLDRGFASYDDQGLLAEGAGGFIPSSRAASETTDRALRFLSGAPAPTASPMFLWVHYYDPHAPYEPPDPYRTRYARTPYYGEVAFVDAQIGRLIEGLPGGRSAWTIVVTGDHGEALGEHGERTHGVGLYDPTLQVPLIISPLPSVASGSAKAPGAGSTHVAPRSSSSPSASVHGGAPLPAGHAGLVDLLPTLCRIAGVPAPASDGIDLMAGPDRSERLLASESAYATTSFHVVPALALRRNDRIWIHHGADELFDLGTDPSETRNLAATEQGRAWMADLAGAMTAQFGADPAAAIARRSLVETPGELEALSGLGYLGGGRVDRPVQSADHRVFLADLETFEDARAAIGRGDGASARVVLRGIVQRYPDATLAWREMGSACIALSDRACATEAYTKALALDPGDAVSALDLGNLMAMAGESVKAESLYLRSLAIEEDQAEAHLNLGLLYAQALHRPAEAATHLRRFLQLAPRDPQAGAIASLVESLK